MKTHSEFELDSVDAAEVDFDLEQDLETAAESRGTSKKGGKKAANKKPREMSKISSSGKQLLVMDTMVPGRDLGAYITAVNGIAILTAEEEQDLAKQYYYEQNVDAARKLVLAHLRFVVHVA